MPNRILRDGILTSERVNSLTWAEEIFYRRLISVVDDFGRFTAHPKLLRAACYPLLLDRVSDADVEKWLLVTEKAALVSVYTARDGKRYLQLHDFRQDVRAKRSKYPAPEEACAADAGRASSTCVADAPQMSSTCVADAPHPRSETETKTETNNARAWPAPCLPFSSPEFGETWAHFVRHRCEIKKPIKPTAAEEILRELASHDEHEAIAALKKSIVSGWPGVYFDGKGPANGHKPPATQDPERQKQRERERQEHNRRMAELAQQEALADLERARKRQEAMKEAVMKEAVPT